MTDDNPRTMWLQMMKLDQELRRLRTGFIFNAEPVRALYRAALARTEAAEAEAADAINDLKIVAAKLTRAERANASLAARVAELEAALAAQQWRPVTEDWPPYNERVIIGHGGGYGGGWFAFAQRVRADNRNEDDWLMDDDTLLAFESAVVAMQRPLPPAPQETE